MEKLNYFTDEVGSPELKNYFESLNEEKLKYELENFTNQYLNLSKEEQLKYAGNVLSICMYFDEIIGKFTTKNILVILNKILLENWNLFTWYENFKYLHVLYLYLLQTKEYEEYSIFFENESYFLRILGLVFNDELEDIYLLDAHILPIFVRLFEQKVYQKKEESILRVN